MNCKELLLSGNFKNEPITTIYKKDQEGFYEHYCFSCKDIETLITIPIFSTLSHYEIDYLTTFYQNNCNKPINLKISDEDKDTLDDMRIFIKNIVEEWNTLDPKDNYKMLLHGRAQRFIYNSLEEINDVQNPAFTIKVIKLLNDKNFQSIFNEHKRNSARYRLIRFENERY